MKRLVRIVGSVGLIVICLPAISRATFTEAEKQAIHGFWTTRAKYETSPASPGAEWCARLTPAGSAWIREAYRHFQSGKVNPTIDPNGSTDQQKRWAAWIDRQSQRDWEDAEKKAHELNSNPTREVTGEPARIARQTGVDKIGRSPSPDPAPMDDPCPSELVALVGAPPKLAAPVRPLRHSVTFPDGTVLSYQDNVRLRPKYAYYRFADGVNSEGQSVKNLPASEFESLIRSAGLSSREEKVMKAVSLLEGGFDSVNTYDTGYVSAGFIQFACLADGTGSLGAMLAHYKSSNPKGFEADFRQYGIDVDGQTLCVLDIDANEVKTGAAAALQVIHDKRLASVFQYSGLKSKSYRVAQLQAAKIQFYPSGDKLLLNLCGSSCSVKVEDVVRTEAGMATLMDRKVNTGKLVGLKENLERLALQYGMTQPSELADLEYVLIRSMKYRQDYLSSTALSKPRDNTVQLSRRGSRKIRSGSK